MATVKQPPPKFHHSEWIISNQMKYANAEAERAAAERLIAESLRAMDASHKTMVDIRDQSTKRLSQRLGDVKHWQHEGETFLSTIKHQTSALVDFNARLDKALESYAETLHITQQCLVTRGKRVGIDLVHDRCEKELVKEVEVCQGVLALYARSKEQAVEQLRLNRKSQYNLEKDLRDKMVSIGVDNYCHELNERSRGNSLVSNDVTVVSAKSSSVDDWLNFTQANIKAAERARQKSAALRSILDQIMQATCHDMQRQVDATNTAFDHRIAETRSAKEKLEDHLKHIRHQTIEMEENIDNIEKSIQEKLVSLRLAHTRLTNRNCRPGIEQTRDTAQFDLVQEVTTLEEMLAMLRERLHHSHCSLKGLDRKKLELEEEIAIKTNSLFIDETECMGLRKSIAVHCY